MNGGYIIMPERLSNELMKNFYENTPSATGTLNNLKEVCQFLYKVARIGKPVVMSGSFRIYLNDTIYTDYPYCCYISIGIESTFMLSKGGEAFVMKIDNMTKGTITYHALDRT